jgi:hypothetical protein
MAAAVTSFAGNSVESDQQRPIPLFLCKIIDAFAGEGTFIQRDVFFIVGEFHFH